MWDAQGRGPYKAFRAQVGNDPKDETKDTTVLIVYNNTENVRRDNATFSIDLEEVITAK